jgi:hypothetical protein
VFSCAAALQYGLKFKFGPMLKVNRMGAKSEEMKEAQ